MRCSSPNHPSRRRRALPLAISAVLGVGLQASAFAQVFPAVIELADLDGLDGFVLNGEAELDGSGGSVAAAGDINGDGIDDLIIGAGGADPNGILNAGRSYVVFGNASDLPHPFNLSTLNGLNGFVLNGEAEGDRSGSVSSGGDVNGDGIDDLIVGARYADPNDNSNAGRSYVVFGSATGLPNPFNLSSLNGLNGFVLNGEAEFDESGMSVSSAGDVNGDGIDDLIVGARYADPNDNFSAGRSYVVFGSAAGLPNPFDLSSLNGLNGFVLDGATEFDFSGVSISRAGDVNGDGIDDLIVGAFGADPNGNSRAGRSYVVFGSEPPLPSPLNLSTLNGLNGFALNGETANDYSGRSVSSAGDVNGDGVDDLIVGAPGADAEAGRSYVVFGSAAGLPNPFALSTLNGLNGFVLNGEAAGDSSGGSLSSAGDVNGDGIDDLIIGAPGASPNGNLSAGRSYVVFGSAGGFPHPFDLSTLNGLNGFVLSGEMAFDSASSVSNAGDVNGDGIDDVIVGAYGADPNDNAIAGRSYVVFGRAAFDLAVQKTNGAGFVAPGAPTTYFIDVSNISGVAVQGATLTDTLPVTLDVGTASWTCTGSGGAVCPNASGGGNLAEIIDLPAGGLLSYELTATVLAAEGENVVNTAIVTLPPDLTDINPGNNSATDSDPVALFAGGFESE